MNKLGNYVLGNWENGSGEGNPLYNAVTGEVLGYATTKGLDFGDITKREIYEISPFNNSTIIYQMTVGEIKNFLKEKLALFWL